MKTLIILCLGIAAYAAPSTTPKPEGGVKDVAADGHRHHNRHHGWGGYGHSNPIVDRNVCDLDASVLVVVEGGRRGYNKARRVKCADVAAADEDSCTICCQNAARRDTSIRNEDIFGFLTVIDHFKKDDDDSWSRESHGDDYARRGKRQTEGEDTEAEAVAEATAQDGEYGRKKGDRPDSLENFEPIKNFRNLKCLCCAPRRQLPPRPIIPVPVPVYQSYPQQQYQAPAQQYGAAAAPQQYQAAAAPQYQAPAAAQPVYQAAAAPQYQAAAQPTYQAAAPMYQAPAAAQPTYQGPVAAAPANY